MVKAEVKRIIVEEPRDRNWATKPDQGGSRQGFNGTFSKPLQPISLGDPYDHHSIKNKADPLWHKKKESRSMCFNIAKENGKRLSVLAEPHDKWVANGPNRGFTPFKALGGPGGNLPPKAPGDKSDLKWRQKMQQSPHKFFGSSSLLPRGELCHDIKQAQYRQVVEKETYNINLLKQMLINRKTTPRGRSINRPKRAHTVQAGEMTQKCFNPDDGFGDDHPISEAEPADSLYSTMNFQYDNVLNPSTRFVHGSGETRDAVCPKCKRDIFFCPHSHDSSRARRLGGARSTLSSTEIGSGSLAQIRSPSPPRRKFSMKPGMTKVFGGDVATESVVGYRATGVIPGVTTISHNDRWK